MQEIQTSFKNGSTITGASAVIERFEIFLISELGGFSPDPEFGLGFGRFIDAQNNKPNRHSIPAQIQSIAINEFPELNLQNLNVLEQENTIRITGDVLVLSQGKKQPINITFDGI